MRTPREWHNLFTLRRPFAVSLPQREAEGLSTQRLRTSVEYRSGRRVWARLSTDRGVAPRPFPVGAEVELELGDAGGLGVCRASVERYAPCAAVPCVVLSLGDELLRRQRRSHVRVPTRLAVRLYDAGVIVPGVACNLSVGGMLVTLETATLQAGPRDQVVFELLPGRAGSGFAAPPTIYGEARVVRRTGDTVALAFGRLADADCAELGRYVHQRLLELQRVGCSASVGEALRESHTAVGR
jgi:hypothetical protein